MRDWAPVLLPIFSLYAAIRALLFVALSIRTLCLRRRLKIAIGDAGNPVMLRAIRVHANFAESVPLGLLLIDFVALHGTNTWLLHALGLFLPAGRAAHAFGVSQVHENYTFRVFGMAMTFTTLIAASAYLVYSYASNIGA